jgi:acylphosphatase
MEEMRYKIRVTGRVQGVGFRHAARSAARYLGLRGYVRNEKDGSVSIEAEGEQASLNEFLAWCRKGPGYGFIERVTVETFPVLPYSEFSIRY